MTPQDILVLVALRAVPILLDVALVWGTSLASIGLSFTNYNGFVSPKFIGGQNYENIFSIYPPLVLFFAVLLDKNIRFSRVCQSALYLPVVLSLAVVGFIAQLIYSRDYGA